MMILWMRAYEVEVRVVEGVTNLEFIFTLYLVN